MPTDISRNFPKRPDPANPEKAGKGFYGFRNRLLARDGFRRLMARFWPSGFIVRREARALFDLCAGFTYTQTLLALVEGGVIGALAKEPRDLDDLSTVLDMSTDNAKRLLAAGQSIGVLTISSREHYALTLRGAALAGDPGIIAMVHHHKLLYRDLADPLALFRAENPDTELNQFFGYAANRDADKLSDNAIADYSELMAQSQRMITAEILSAHGFRSSRRLVDIGGGYGVFARSLLAHRPNLQISVLDLPSVAGKAALQPENMGYGDRLSFVGGDFLKTRLPYGIDTATLVRVLFDHEDILVCQLLKHIATQLPAGGRLFVAEPMAETKGAEPVGDAYYGLYLKAMGHGRIRTADRHKALLKSAGFKRVKEIRTSQPIITRLLEASL